MPYVTVKNWPEDKKPLQRNYRFTQIAAFMAGVSGTLGITVPSGMVWYPISIIANAPIVEAWPETISIHFVDNQGNRIFNAGGYTLPAAETAWWTWGIGIEPSTFDNGALPPQHHYTMPLLDVKLQTGFSINAVRTFIGGVGANDLLVGMYYLEEVITR